ncbi:histidine kinase [Flammeovirgaceae bacterium SG7u.111]|nr:histidine kinase [Flammeovirgaceae bacterium SG7u.132]WPO33609.1 histidine kinase [Flammeovirgaceae bacterium SG7u.111]
MSTHNYSWIFKYKLHHLLFWAAYHFFWWLVFENGDAVKTVNNISYPPFAIKFSFYVVFQAIGVYFCLYFLIPRFLEKGKYTLFFLALGATLVAMGLTVMSGYYLSSFLIGKEVGELYQKPGLTGIDIFIHNSFPSAIGSMTLGMSIKLAKNYLESQKREQELAQEKLETELKFLKSQFNPHFLFNTINSIFVLINKNTEMATESLAKFSSLLRYQLYECNEAQIPLSREVMYLEGFIELEKLRLDESFEVKVDLPLQATGNQMIAPFILMPFIENAFKHVSQHIDQKNWIAIHLGIQNNKMSFNVANSYTASSESAKEAIEYGGLGLENVKRRLALLYPGKFELATGKTNGQYEVKLSLELQEKTLIKPEPVLSEKL